MYVNRKEQVVGYCQKCGARHAGGADFCPKCGNPLKKIQTPDVDVPPPPQSPLRAFWYGTEDPRLQNTGQGTPAVVPRSAPRNPPTEQHSTQIRNPIWTGVNIGCGMFIVLPLIIMFALFVLVALAGSG